MIRTLLCAAAMAAAATSAMADHPILPGYWESTSRATFIIEQPPKTDHRCLTPETVDQYLSTPSTSHYKCTYTKRDVGGGRADFEGQCHDKHGRTFPISIHGTYEPERFRMKLVVPNLPISAVTEAKRISASCPAGK
jgi:hypothetical protein